MVDECLKFPCKEKGCRGDKCTAKRNDRLIIIQHGKFGRYVGLTISIQYFSSYTIKQNKKYTKARVIERDRFGGGSVLVCGGIMGGNKTRLIVINGNINA